jgi:Co/Zn/Cd efflux system component
LTLGFIGFPSSAFWQALYLERVWHASALMTAVYLLPMAVMGILINVLAAWIMHRVSNKLMMLSGAICYTISFLLFSLNKTSYGYWPMLFPGFCLTVVGADLHFNVTNVSVENKGQCSSLMFA